MFDYIIVGGGSAGCVLANRLSEDPSVKVLLLEAGGKDSKMMLKIPAAFYKNYKTDVDWAYESTPQESMGDRQIFLPRGKVLGGSGSINAMIYIRGHKLDYDSWAKEGNKGWGYEDVLPYFKRGEDQARGGNAFHGEGGPLHVSDPTYVNPLTQAFLMACKEVGLPVNPDFNGARQEGVGLFQRTIKRGKRYSPVAAYLKPARSRSNLKVETHALVQEIILEGKRAVGVKYQQAGQSRTAKAEREIILCAGAYNSPQLLMLSGIGPGKHLKEMGIPVAVNLPGVGENLQDHLAVGLIMRCNRDVSLDTQDNLGNLMRYMFLKKGPFTSNVAEAGAFIRTQPDLPAPDIQFHFGPCFFVDHGFTKPDGNGITIGPTLLQPKSRGTVRLQSADPKQAPLIDHRYLSEEEDVATLVAGIKLARRVFESHSLSSYVAAYYQPVSAWHAEEEVVSLVRRAGETLYHPCGTCRMGNGPMDVVDAQLRVRGVEGLRVADASIMPNVVRGNTHAPTLMIAEKASDLILGKTLNPKNKENPSQQEEKDVVK